MTNIIAEELERQVENTPPEETGHVGRIAANYNLDSDRLLGLLLKLDFAESHVVTYDAWKRK